MHLQNTRRNRLKDRDRKEIEQRGIPGANMGSKEQRSKKQDERDLSERHENEVGVDESDWVGTKERIQNLGLLHNFISTSKNALHILQHERGLLPEKEMRQVLPELSEERKNWASSRKPRSPGGQALWDGGGGKQSPREHRQYGRSKEAT